MLLHFGHFFNEKWSLSLLFLRYNSVMMPPLMKFSFLPIFSLFRLEKMELPRKLPNPYPFLKIPLILHHQILSPNRIKYNHYKSATLRMTTMAGKISLSYTSTTTEGKHICEAARPEVFRHINVTRRSIGFQRTPSPW